MALRELAESQRPRVDRPDHEPVVAPGIRSQRRANLLRVACAHDQQEALLVAERPAETDELRVLERVHEACLRVPARLLVHRDAVFPGRSALADYGVEANSWSAPGSSASGASASSPAASASASAAAFFSCFFSSLRSRFSSRSRWIFPNVCRFFATPVGYRSHGGVPWARASRSPSDTAFLHKLWTLIHSRGQGRRSSGIYPRGERWRSARSSPLPGIRPSS